MKVIQITAVVLGDSSCTGASCCIKDSDCTRDASANHRADVHSRCNNRQSCTVGVLKEKIPCGYWGVWYNNDFERITYNCIDDPQRSTTATTTFSRPHSTRITFRREENTSKKETEKGSTTATFSTSSRSASTEVAEETRSKMETENDHTTSSIVVENDTGSQGNVEGYEKNGTPPDRSDNSWSTHAAFSQTDSTENRLRTEEITPKKKTENGSTSATSSTSDSIENILQTKETTPEMETKHDDTTTSTALKIKEVSKQNVNMHDGNGTPEDLSGNSWSTTATSSRSDSTKDILFTEEKPPEKKTKTVDTASSADRDKNKKGSYDIGHDENGSHENRSDNPWIIPVVMATVCLLVLVAIVVLVAMMRRKNRLKGIVAAEMTYLGSYGSEAINGNENQTISLNNGNGSPIHINDMIKESNNTDPEVPENSEVPNNTVYNSVACYAGSKPTEDTLAMESREPCSVSDTRTKIRHL